jgi:hypothetical protein
MWLQCTALCCLCANSPTTDCADTELRSHTINPTTLPSTAKRVSCRCALTFDSWHLTVTKQQRFSPAFWKGSTCSNLGQGHDYLNKILCGISQPPYAKTESKIWPRKFLPEHLKSILCTAPTPPRNCANIVTTPTVYNRSMNCEELPLGRSRCRWEDSININMGLK